MMAILLKFVDTRNIEISGLAKLHLRATQTDGRQDVSTSEHTYPSPFSINVNPMWRRLDITIEHDDYSPLTFSLSWDRPGSDVAWSDPPTNMTSQNADQIMTIPLSRIRFAPGQIPPFGIPTGDEKGVYIQQVQGQPQYYAGHGLNLLPVGPLRRLDESTIWGTTTVTSVVTPYNDDGWTRFVTKDISTVDVNAGGGFVWLEYGSTSARPTQPRFLIAVWIPKKAILNSAIDMLVFYSPSTATDLYPVSKFPFRDKYPYSALGKPFSDEDGVKHEAKVQPYVLLGYKYLFRPNYLVPMSLASGKPLVVVTPIFPNATSKQDNNKHMWQPFNSKAGLYRLLIEIRLFLEREGYNLPTFGVTRLNGAVAPISGNPPPPPPAFTTKNRQPLAIRQIVVSGYSSSSLAVESLFRTDVLSARSATDYPPALFGADAAEFDKHWEEFWDLDFTLAEARTGIPRSRYETQIKQFLTRNTRRVRLYHGGWTLDKDPDQFFPNLRKLLSNPPRRVEDAKFPARWASDWRDPRGQWSALFFSAAFLRAKTADKVIPIYPIGEPDGTKGDPPPAIHGFTAQLGLGHALWMRRVP
ncbi:hypothetical protein C7B80_30960 [Cyanosarcina cf. burmensis CCALA 770]|nr:hypothetical protein C7B80_30960 [Cyanosarcina cf. burmensis CCALA 770]